jgi:hypothetical protein
VFAGDGAEQAFDDSGEEARLLVVVYSDDLDVCVGMMM